MTLAAAAAARLPGAPDNFLLGRDGGGEPCAAARNWHDPRLTTPFDHAWSVTCRGVSASRPVAWVIAARTGAASPIDPKHCAPAQSREMANIGKVDIRNCADDIIGGQAVTISFERKGTLYAGAAQILTVGPLEIALRTAAGVGGPPTARDADAKVSIALTDLPPAPGSTTAVAAVSFDAFSALQTGIALNHRGFYVEASRLLNDALSRSDERTTPLVHVELELEAALADSNISQLDAADDHFKRAEALFGGYRGSDRAAFLQAKFATYRGMDRLNRRQWQAAVQALIDTSAQANPLQDPAILSRLNQPPASGVRSTGIGSVDGAQLERLQLEAQRNWAMSVANLALNQDSESRAAIQRASQAVIELERSVSSATIAPLKSRVERQLGRIEAHAGHIDPALAQFDCAIATLQGIVGRGCALDPPTTARVRAAQSGTIADGPMLAETELERASVLSRKANVAPETLLAAYTAGIDALIASGATGSGVPVALEDYLNLLAKLNAAQPNQRYVESFFRAIQVIGEPAIARQLAQLQNVVTSGGAIGAKVRDREELERLVVRLRYTISTSDPTTSSAQIAALETERATAEAKLAAVNAEIAADPQYRAVDDQPVTAADVQGTLRTREAYLKIIALRNSAYGIVISKDRSFIYPLAAPARVVSAISQRVRASIRDESGQLPFFDVPASFTLFRLIAGPAEKTLIASKSIVVDPSGPLESLPASVLVIDEASMRTYVAHRATTPNDYSKVAFLGQQVELSNALSPRSFIIARKLPPSKAEKPFIGFGENAPPAMLSADQMARKVSFGTGCPISYGDLAAIMSANKPVSAKEISLAATALGYPNAPEVTGQAFTDTKVESESDNGNFLHYQVVHFATHGLPETRFRCTVVPPALVTTLAPPSAAGAPESDGLLSFSEIARLRLDANLVVLSACETSAGVSSVGGRLAGQDESAQSLDGLVRAFITANARAVLATYWKVPATKESDDLIAAFYASGRTETIGSALRDAQAQLIRQPAVSHPYFWGAYFLVGDAAKTMLSPSAGTH
jgi:tetratricopeptide (TPR) repeat protein